MKKSIVIAVTMTVLGIAALLYGLSPDNPGTALTQERIVHEANASGAGFANQPRAGFTTGLEGLPRSLQGTEVDGELEADAGGHLKISNGVRRVFDYFLSAIGEEPLESILARLRAYFRHKLPTMAANEAERLLDSYVAYKRSLEDIHQASATNDGSINVQAVRQQMQQVQALRTQYFTPEVIAAFFGDEDIYDRYTLARLDLLQDKNLSAVQRAQQLAALEEQLPPAMRESMKTISQVQNLESLTADWKKRGGSAAELRQIRENLVGAEAADRLETLDTENTAWDQRMNAWYSERAAIFTNKNLSEQDRAHQLEELRKSRFNEVERLRVQSLERMHDRGEHASG